MNDNPDLSKENMKLLAQSIENYINELMEVMIIPDNIQKEYGPVINASIHDAKKLIKKLKKGDTNVFKDEYVDL